MQYKEWVDHYLPLLTAGRVQSTDARTAIDFGWLIGHIDQACFPYSHAPVSFGVVHDQPELREVAATYEQRDDEQGSYEVFPVGLFAKVEVYSATLDHLLTYGSILWALAAHEVRHRVQHERPTLVHYDHAIPGRANVFVRIVMESIRIEQLKRTEDACQKGSLWFAHLEAEWKEYDAAVVERLVLHLKTPPLEEVVAIVLADAPR